MNSFKAKSLYICYFWIDEPLVQTQVLPYLREITKDGIKVALLTFEKKNWTKEEVDLKRKQLAEQGIEWEYLKYHKRFSILATSYDVLRGALHVWNKVRKEHIDVLHGRVHVPTLMAVLAKKFSFSKKPKVIFDIRGFFPEEYTDAGVWKENGFVYKIVKKVEKWIFKQSDGFVVLTERARRILFPESQKSGKDQYGRPVEVIPCCVDFTRFEQINSSLLQETKHKLNSKTRNVIVYVGSFGGWYMTDEIMDFFKVARDNDPTTFALVLTQSDAQVTSNLLRSRGFSEQDFLVKKVSPSEIPLYLNAANIAISFIKPCYSKQASSPTKNAEYLACGLPIIANDKIGDTTEFTEADQTGVIIKTFNEESYIWALKETQRLLEDKALLSKRCRESAKKRFDLETVGGHRYRRIYQNLLKKN